MTGRYDGVRIAVISCDGRLKDLALPLSLGKLESVAKGTSSLCLDEEKAVLKWIRNVNVQGIEHPLSEDRLEELSSGGIRTTPTEDHITAEWVLRVWTLIEVDRNRG